MKKRLFCMLLCLILVLPMVLSACSTEEEEGADVSEDLGAQTITVRMVTERKVCNTDDELEEYLKEECGNNEKSEEYKEMLAVKANYDRVEKAFSNITKKKFNVNVDFIFYTWDEYRNEDSDKRIENTMDKYALEEVNKARAERALDKYVADFKAAFPEESYPLKAIGENFLKYYPEYKTYIDIETYFEEEDEDEDDKVAEDQYMVNPDTGIKELIYPEADENQLDIIYISGYEMYSQFVDNNWILPLDEHIKTTGKELGYQIHDTLLNGVKKNGITYAVPNNTKMGEYTYMLIDQTLFDEYHYIGQNYPEYTEIKNVLDVAPFLKDISDNHADEVIPLDSSFKECMDLFVWYWNIDMVAEDSESANATYKYVINTENNFSLYGTVYDDPSKVGRGQIELGFNYLMADERYQEIFLSLKDYEFKDYYRKENDDRQTSAVKFVKGDYTVMSEALEKNGVYTDENRNTYYPYIVKYPVADEEALYGNMYAISSNSQHVKACMDVITLINTNEEARNLLQYGILGDDYTIDSDGFLHRKQPVYNDKGEMISAGTYYKMDIKKTGNCFIAHPEEGMPKDYWEDAKIQNNHAVIDPLLGFDFNEQLLANGQRQLDNMNMDRAGIDTDGKWNDYTDYDDLKTVILNDINALCEAKDAAGLEKFIKSDLKVVYSDEESAKVDTNQDKYLVGLNQNPAGLAGLVESLDGKPYMYVAGSKPSINLGGLTSSTAGDDDNGPSPYQVYYSWLTQYKYLPATSIEE